MGGFYMEKKRPFSKMGGFYKTDTARRPLPRNGRFQQGGSAEVLNW